MTTKARDPKPPRRNQSLDIPMSAIRRYARQIVEKFQPEKVILFGSYARGEEREGSDVDLFVVMPCANHTSQAIRIRLALRAPFAMDLLVRSPKCLHERLLDGDWFLREIVETGKVLYAKDDRRMGSQSRSRLAGRATARQFAVDYRYPGESARTRQAKAALRSANRVRQKLRCRLGLPT